MPICLLTGRLDIFPLTLLRYIKLLAASRRTVIARRSASYFVRLAATGGSGRVTANRTPVRCSSASKLLRADRVDFTQA